MSARLRELLLADEDGETQAPRPRAAGPPLPPPADEADLEEEYVPLKRRRLLEAQERNQRLGLGAAAEPSARHHETASAEQPQQASCCALGAERSVLKAPFQQTSLLVRAAELKRERPVEDDAARLAREELEILKSITVRCELLV
jgi:hypothetical protein